MLKNLLKHFSKKKEDEKRHKLFNLYTENTIE